MINPQAEQSTTEIAISEILNQIAVCQPYFAFEKIRATSNGGVVAVIPPLEQPMDSECGIRAAAEIGRHLAILGSCAVARRNSKEGKHFYLAQKARLRATDYYQSRILQNELSDMQAATLTGYAKAEFSGNRKAHADVRIVSDANNQDLYHLEVEYAVLTPRAFERFFSAHRVEDFLPNPDIYRNQVGFDNLVEDLFFDEHLLSARFGFEPSACAGHFPTYPALPVAVLMFILSKAAGTLLDEVTGKQGVPYVVVDADIRAEHLAFPHEKLYLVVKHAPDAVDGSKHTFECRAIAEGNQQHKFGEMDLILQVVEPG